MVTRVECAHIYICPRPVSEKVSNASIISCRWLALFSFLYGGVGEGLVFQTIRWDTLKGVPSSFFFLFARRANTLFIRTPKVCECPLSPRRRRRGPGMRARGVAPTGNGSPPPRRAPGGGGGSGGGRGMRRMEDDFLTFFFLFFDLSSIKHTSIAHS